MMQYFNLDSFKPPETTVNKKIVSPPPHPRFPLELHYSNISKTLLQRYQIESLYIIIIYFKCGVVEGHSNPEPSAEGIHQCTT